MISMCVLSYNRLSFLKDTIRSMVGTATTPLEIIVHDDGSSEPGLREWLTCMVECGGISHLILNPAGHNEGQGIAVNRMAAIAKGSIIVKCDQDLVFKPGWDRALIDTFGANYRSSKAKNRDRIGALGLFKYHVEPVHHEEMYLHSVRHEGIEWDVCKDFVGSLLAMPRDAWKILGPWDERSVAFAEDAVWKQRITGLPGWCCALTPQDYVENRGFGVGPSTLVKGFDSEGAGILQRINYEPALVTEIRG